MQTPEHTIAMLAVVGITIAVAARLVRWLFAGPVTPDPWGEQISAQIDNFESMPVCHRCLTEHSSIAHFCPQCGAAVGGFNNVMPYEYVFSEGEVLRNGTMANVPLRFPIVAGYLLLSLSAYAIFAPVYWFFLFRNLARRAEAPSTL